MDQDHTGKRAGGGRRFDNDGGTAEDREHGGSEGWTAERAVKGVGEQRDEDRGSEGENGDLVTLQKAEALVVGEIHEPELECADAGEGESGAWGDAAKPEKWQEDKQGESEAGGGDKSPVETRRQMLDKPEGKRPKQGDEKEQGHGGSRRLGGVVR